MGFYLLCILTASDWEFTGEAENPAYTFTVIPATGGTSSHPTLPADGAEGPLFCSIPTGFVSLLFSAGKTSTPGMRMVVVVQLVLLTSLPAVLPRPQEGQEEEVEEVVEEVGEDEDEAEYDYDEELVGAGPGGKQYIENNKALCQKTENNRR